MLERNATEILDLPSKGWYYPTENLLSKGSIEIRYMGAREEDILTSTNLIKKGVAIDMVLKNVIVSKINYDDLLIGDKNALMVATRVLGYGKDYQIQLTCPSCEKKQTRTVDLSNLEHKTVDFESTEKGKNEFEFELPSGTKITFKFLTSGDELAIDAEVSGLKKMNSSYSPDLSTRMKKLITSVNGKRDVASINKFVNEELVASDSLSLRKHLAKVQPGIELSFDFTCENNDGCGYEEKMAIPLTVEFFWPGGSR
jgi:hypothetical protein